MPTPTTVVSLEEAKAHLLESRTSAEPEVQRKLDAAIIVAQNFLNRNVYGDADALAAAVAGVPAALATAKTAYDEATTAASEIEDCLLSGLAQKSADEALLDAIALNRMVARGVVVDAGLKSGILLILGHLYEDKQDVVTGTIVSQVPMGSQYVLQPYRVGLGV